MVYVTVPSQEVGEKLAGLLVHPDSKLAACVNIIPGMYPFSPLRTLSYVQIVDGSSSPPYFRTQKPLYISLFVSAGLTSIYCWEGKVNKDAELLLIIKTRESLVPKLTEVVKKNHPYDECEVISLPVTGGSASYIQWIHDSTLDG